MKQKRHRGTRDAFLFHVLVRGWNDVELGSGRQLGVRSFGLNGAAEEGDDEAEQAAADAQQGDLYLLVVLKGLSFQNKEQCMNEVIRF